MTDARSILPSNRPSSAWLLTGPDLIAKIVIGPVSADRRRTLRNLNKTADPQYTQVRRITHGTVRIKPVVDRNHSDEPAELMGIGRRDFASGPSATQIPVFTTAWHVETAHGHLVFVVPYLTPGEAWAAHAIETNAKRMIVDRFSGLCKIRSLTKTRLDALSHDSCCDDVVFDHGQTYSTEENAAQAKSVQVNSW